MIDWNKPIETTDGKQAWVLETADNGWALITYVDAENSYCTVSLFKNEKLLPVRNKPDLIKPEGWVNVYPAGFVNHQTTEQAISATLDNCVAIITAEELISGKFKDGIPKGYGLGGDDA